LFAVLLSSDYSGIWTYRYSAIHYLVQHFFEIEAIVALKHCCVAEFEQTIIFRDLQLSTLVVCYYLLVTNLFFLNQPPVAHSASSRDVLRTSVPQVIEVTGSESPSTFGWTARNNRVRQELSRARIRAIENSLENGQGWVPPSSAHRKTWEEEVNPNSFFSLHFVY
jgi:hypothetical protein